ncbi:hypothetical protein ACIBCR_16255 [Micromonospora echinospora]|uniref:hypothetical protein n=1 Tax=Micromonospora echinospora TaxID=1877 RepID=UPI0037AA5524
MTESTGAQLIHDVTALATRAHAGEPVAAELADACQRLRLTYDNPPGLPYRQRPWPPRPRVDDPLIDLSNRIRWDHDGYLAVPAGEVRAVDPGGPMPLVDRLDCNSLRTLPGTLPADDDALVVVYDVTLPVSGLLLAVARGQDTGPHVASLVQRIVHARRHPWE